MAAPIEVTRRPRARTRRSAAVAAAAGLAIAAVGCGSSSDTATDAPTASSSTTAAPANTAPTTAPATTAPTTAAIPEVPGQVLIRDYELLPPTITVAAGETVTWQNSDDVEHHMLSDDGTTLDTGAIPPGQATPATLTSPGTYDYYCDIHNAMTGTIVVQ